MWFYTGREAAITLTSGETLKGRLGWSWTWGMLRLKDVKIADGDQDVELAGLVFVPRPMIQLVQVV